MQRGERPRIFATVGFKFWYIGPVGFTLPLQWLDGELRLVLWPFNWRP